MATFFRVGPGRLCGHLRSKENDGCRTEAELIFAVALDAATVGFDGRSATRGRMKLHGR